MVETNKINTALTEIKNQLKDGIIPFWLERGIDNKYGGYLTCFDEDGKRTEETNKYLVTQSRMIWGFSSFYNYFGDKVLLDKAKHGLDFLIKYFWDQENGGWFWKVRRDGTLINKNKILYGQSFAIYGLSEYFLCNSNQDSLEYAETTFDLIQKYCTDTAYGGYYENFNKDWVLLPAGLEGGDRKTFDVHMHLLEAFTKLVEASDSELHKRKLKEIITFILNNMVDQKIGCGLNHLNRSLEHIKSIDLKHTWNSERNNENSDSDIYTTSYGHNIELVWLLNHACKVLDIPYYNKIIKKIIDHTIKYGYDTEYGGIYRDGPLQGEAIVQDKEWWQNVETLVGFLEAYERFGEQSYLNAFYKSWEFNKKYMIDNKLGEWRQLIGRKGNVIQGQLGNYWKVFYHTGRAMLECIKRLERIVEEN